VSDKSAAVLPATPRKHMTSPKGSSAGPGIAPAEFGERLLRGREQNNHSLQEIADITKIAIHQLRALERGDLHRLPGGLYRRAIVRQYAGAVGLNVEETLRDLANVRGEVDRDVQPVDAVAAPRGDAGSSPSSTALWSSATPLLVAGTVAVLAAVWYSAGPTPPAADVPVTAASAPAAQADVPPIALAAGTEAVRATAGDIDLATESAVLKEPETINIIDADTTEGELRVTSEPSGAQITVNGIGWGVTPVTIPYMPFGKKVIRATMPGFLSAQRVFDFLPDRRGRAVRIQLSPESPETR